MECDDYKKYNILENILHKVNRWYVALPEEDVKSNNKVLPTIDRVIEKMKSKSVLFANLYQDKFYGGSYYDGLKVGKPNEYDLDCLLRLPKVLEPKVQISDKPGYVFIVVNLEALQKKTDEAKKYEGLEKFLNGDRLSTRKARSWMESLMTNVLKKAIVVDTNDKNRCTLKSKTIKSGPAHTIKLEGICEDRRFSIDIDLVPCFTFFDDNWPQGDYRKNTSVKKNRFFVVPKSPSESESDYWRLSFQEQERELINNCSGMKPTLRLIKKIRDRYNHKIASYHIKTIFLWEVENIDRNLWSKPLSYVFVAMLRKYVDYITRRNIPYYWNRHHNLIENLSEATAANVGNKIRNIVDRIERICNTRNDCHSILEDLLDPSEYNLEAFLKEVPLSKKILKQSPVSESQCTAVVESPPVEPVNVEGTEASSSNKNSNFIDNLEPVSVFVPTADQAGSQLEAAQFSLISSQNEILKEILSKTDSCLSQVKQLSQDFQKKKQEDDEKFEDLASEIDAVNRKLDILLKRNSFFTSS